MKATYSYSNLQRCADEFKKFDWSAQNKKQHKAKAQEVKKLWELCYDLTKCANFWFEHSEADRYIKATDLPTPKKDLDICLNFCKRHIARELNEIHSLMVSGEVDSID